MMTPEEALFAGIYPAGIVYADRRKTEHGDYRKAAFLAFSNLALTWYRCPDDLRKLVQADAEALQAKQGEEYQTSTSGHTVTLGYDL